jgi:hypothetical protein
MTIITQFTRDNGSSQLSHDGERIYTVGLYAVYL